MIKNIRFSMLYRMLKGSLMMAFVILSSCSCMLDDTVPLLHHRWGESAPWKLVLGVLLQCLIEIARVDFVEQPNKAASFSGLLVEMVLLRLRR